MLRLIGTWLMLGWATSALAAEDPALYPSKPVRVVVGFAAGGGNDFLARLASQKLTELLHQPFVVENKPGAGAQIATEYVAKATPDGYTLLMGASGAMSVSPAVYDKLGYDTLKDFVPVSMFAGFPLVLVVAPSQPVKTVAELITYAKANPAKSNYSSSSPAFQLATELLKQKTGAPIEHVPYKSSGESVAAAMSGEVLMALADAGPSVSQLKAGQVRALAVTGTRRMADFPDVPTFTEAGVPGMEFTLWSGIFAPAATPPAIAQKLEQALIAAAQAPAVQERLRQLAIEPGGTTTAQFADLIAADIARWKAVAKAGSVKLER